MQFPSKRFQRYNINGKYLRNNKMNPVIAVVAQGAMGAGIGGRLVERGLRVITSLEGRSDASAKRAAAAGMVAVSDAECAKADFFLSILPPSEALPLAEKMAALIKPNNHKPVYVDCNAVSPPTKVKIGEVIVKAGAPFIDVGIMGMPPRPNYDGPYLIVAGPESGKFAPLGNFGLNLRLIDGSLGAASAVKMSYAGITKGITALGSMVMLAATRGGAANELRHQLERSHPYFMQNFRRAVPDMFDKAYRFVGEMEEIADFVGDDWEARQMYLAFAEFYRRMAADDEGERRETAALEEFLKPKA
jgi:3-hydroxyisobutyrate dehydrogenase-like beta-hydroxyacid dehydrogenase